MKLGYVIALLTLISLIGAVSAHGQARPPGGGGGGGGGGQPGPVSSNLCPRIEGIKGCPPPSGGGGGGGGGGCSANPDPNAGQPCTGTITVCTGSSTYIRAHITPGTCQSGHQECTGGGETPVSCGFVCDVMGPDTCAEQTITCDTGCSQQSASGTINDCGSCIVSGGVYPTTCQASSSCPP